MRACVNEKLETFLDLLYGNLVDDTLSACIIFVTSVEHDKLVKHVFILFIRFLGIFCYGFGDPSVAS